MQLITHIDLLFLLFNEFSTNFDSFPAHSASEKIFSCGFCAAQFYSSQTLAEHYDDHFSPGNCGNCDQRLLFINGDLFYLHLHIATKCIEENQHSWHTDDDRPGTISNISTEVDIKEEICENPLINEALTKMQYRIRGEAEYLQTREVNYVEDRQWSEEGIVGDLSLVKLEDTPKGEVNIEKSVIKNLQIGRSGQNDIRDKSKIWDPKQCKLF